MDKAVTNTIEKSENTFSSIEYIWTHKNQYFDPGHFNKSFIMQISLGSQFDRLIFLFRVTC